MNRFLLFAVLLLAGQAQAYVILESKYHVEVKPGVFEDQLVLKCDNGRQITVPWEARLSESCGEVIIPRAAAAEPASPKAESQERQKEILMSRVREQYGNVDERHVTAEAGPDGAEPHFSPQMREILKRYELCRKNTKGSPSCAAERNQAMAALSAQPSGSEPAAAESAVVEPQPTAKGKTAKHKPMPSNAETSPASAEAEPQQTAMPPSPPAAAPAPDRAARAQKIADDYAWCMRAKPKFECETARAAALKALDMPGKPKSKSKAAARATQAPDVAAN
jgi:hypothetical protein